VDWLRNQPALQIILGALGIKLPQARDLERRYAQWFIRKWGRLENPYPSDTILPVTEHLDSTFIPLSFRSSSSPDEEQHPATAVLGDRSRGNQIVLGAPGSGKSILLRAYGVGLLKGRASTGSPGGRTDEIPFFVQLRKLAQRFPDPDGALANDIIDEILVSGAEITRTAAEAFFRHALLEDRALVMLDGLDEVTEEFYTPVRDAVYAFVSGHTPALPTHRARIIVSCRQENFLPLRDEWVPGVAETVCTLAPLRDADIVAYLDLRRAEFRTPGGPERFLEAVVASGTLELHRLPLIIAMSVGMFAHPRSTATLFQRMIIELLDRHSFRFGPTTPSANRFNPTEKYRLLLEFALYTAVSGFGFHEFTHTELLDFATRLRPRLETVRREEIAAFVAEIIDRSGLIVATSDTGYIFAHRSIQEYLASEELVRAGADGARTLLERATDPEWRQVIVYYAAQLDMPRADGFLQALHALDLNLATRCLAVADASDESARVVLDALGQDDPAHVESLVNVATTAPRESVRQMAVGRLEYRLRTLRGGVIHGVSASTT